MIVPHSRVKNVDGVKGKTGICLFWECENETRARGPRFAVLRYVTLVLAPTPSFCLKLC